MRIWQAHFKVYSWIAILAFVMAAVAPTISHALRDDAAERWTDEICSSAGPKSPTSSARPNRAGPTPEPSQIHSLEHCPFCSLQAGAGWLPTAVPAVVLLALSSEVPRPIQLTAERSNDWKAAQARGPPQSLSR